MPLSNPGLPLKLNLADPDTGKELTAYVAHAPAEYFDPETGRMTPDGPERITEIEELLDADTGDHVAITDGIRRAIQAAFDADEKKKKARLYDAIDHQHLG